ncbi:MAG: hypothetical protein RLZZ292_2425 [Bacteroidota bacterium]|jgi:hypothetical protein
MQINILFDNNQVACTIIAEAGYIGTSLQETIINDSDPEEFILANAEQAIIQALRHLLLGKTKP